MLQRFLSIFQIDFLNRLVIVCTYWKYGEDAEDERECQSKTATGTADQCKEQIKSQIGKIEEFPEYDCESIPVIFLDNMQWTTIVFRNTKPSPEKLEILNTIRQQIDIVANFYKQTDYYDMKRKMSSISQEKLQEEIEKRINELKLEVDELEEKYKYYGRFTVKIREFFRKGVFLITLKH